MLRIEPAKEDQAESAILELVDGPKDMRFAMTAKTLSNIPIKMRLNELTAKNVQKVTQFRKNGVEHLRDMVSRMRKEKKEGWDDRKLLGPRRVYLLEDRYKRDMHLPDEAEDWELPNKTPLRHSVVADARTKVWEAKQLVKEKKEEKAQAQEEKRQRRWAARAARIEARAQPSN